MLVIGLLSGLAGGLIALQLDDQPAAAPAATTTPAPRVEPTDAERLRAAAAKVSPAVVRVLTAVGESGGNRSGTTSIGSGIVVDEGGLVLTNFHVIEDFEALTVVLSTGEQRPAQLVADDAPFQDMALLSIEPGGLRAAKLGDSDLLRVGDPIALVSAGVVAGSTQVRSGIVSFLGIQLDLEDVILEGMIQTDAAINIGDSGGALMNLDGEVVGLVTANLRVTPEGDVVEGVGFAHAISTIKPIVDSVVATGISGRPRYGIERVGEEHLPINDLVQNAFALPVSQGALIVAVPRGSPAEDGGVLPGDIVLTVNGETVGDGRPLPNLLKAGADVVLTVLRDGEERRLTVLPAPVEPAPR